MTLEWQVSSPPPLFNFDEIPQVVGGPYEYGVPGAVHAVMNGGREQVPVPAGGGHGREVGGGNGNGADGHTGNGHDLRRNDGAGCEFPRRDTHGRIEPAHVLVVANETVGGDKLLEAIKRRAEPGPRPLHRRVPRRTRRGRGFLIHDDTAESAAQIRLDLTIERLGEMGIEARGEVMDPDPFLATSRTPSACTLPTRSSSRRDPYPRSGFLRRDLIERIEE